MISKVSQNETSELGSGTTDITIQDCLEILSNKIETKFTKIASAFRHFDLHSKGKISFSDF